MNNNDVQHRGNRSQTVARSRPQMMWLAIIGAVIALVAVAPMAAAAPAQAATTTGPQVQVEQAAEQGQRLEIERRGALLIGWGSGMEDVQYIQGGYLQMDGTSGHGEIEVRDGWTGETRIHEIPNAYPSMGGLGLEIDVKSGGMFPQVVTFSTLAGGSPLYQGPDGGYEGDLEDWAGINDMEVMGLSFR